MENLRYFENEETFFVDYIYNDNNIKKCLRLSEDNDYFSFCLFSQSNDLKKSQIVKIHNNNPLFLPLLKLLENNNFIEILEEGSNEGKSLIFKYNQNYLELIFILKNNPSNSVSISLTNIRLASPEITFCKNSPTICNFKNKLHSALSEIKNCLHDYSM